VKLPEGVDVGEHHRVLYTPASKALTRRLHGSTGRILVTDESHEGAHIASLLRAAACAGAHLSSDPDAHLRISVTNDKGSEVQYDSKRLSIGHTFLSTSASHHSIQDAFEPVTQNAIQSLADPTLNHAPSERILCFESLMNSDMPHNDKELSQGVLHMISPLAGTPTKVHFANLKMSITGEDRLASGLESLQETLQEGPFSLICITLLEGYFEGVKQLIQTLREGGCRAHIAVGGAMPTLAPEHVATHLPGVSFICRGAGEQFIKPLVEILGNGNIDTPLDSDQIHALLALDGLIARVQGPDGPTLVSARSDQVVEVPDLDRIRLDLSYLEPRHIEGGIEISTSRGCIHKCTFCSIMGREQYQARSAGNVFDVLNDYQKHFETLFGQDVPQNAYRVHICDDDFACDRDRAAEFFRQLPSSPFKLSSVQVSVADLCLREDNVLTTIPDVELLDTITPDCFADEGRPIPSSDFVADHQSRNWSSYLQIGVETFSEAELKRLGKGYTVDHIRIVVNELAARGLHMDAYFIQSNSFTSAADLIDGLDELCRTKMAHPHFFHVRFPIVPHLVSYFTSASYRRLVRQDQEDNQKCLHIATVENHPEYDYPFVANDIPQDPWVATAVEEGFFTDVDRYAGSFENLRNLWIRDLETMEDVEQAKQGERLVRQLDDRARRRSFELLKLARQVENNQRAWRPGIPDPDSAMANATAILGPSQRWLLPFKRYVSETAPRMVVIPTWQCELRCRYCYIPKQDGRVMTKRTLERSIDMLIASDHDEVILQFFGGEALIEWDLIQHGLTYGTTQAQAWGKSIRYILSSNGWSINEEKLDWLKNFPVKLELSLDGDAETQNKFRRALMKGQDSYDSGIPHKVDILKASGIDHEVIMVVHPEAVEKMPKNFFHIMDLGFPRVQINFALGALWTPEQKQRFASGLHEIGSQLEARWAQGHEVSLINLEGKPMPIRLNGEITVDWDGTIYGGNAFLHETEHKQKFVIGHLDDLGGFDRYWLDMPTNDYLLDWSYPPDVTQNNLEVGRIFRSFHQWMWKTERIPTVRAK